MRKKGNVNDILFGLVMLVVIIIGFVAFFPAWDEVAKGLNSSSSVNQKAKDQLAPSIDNIPAVFNQLYVLIFFGSFGAVIALAWLIRSNMLFLFIAITVLAIFVFISAVMANTYDDFVQSDPAYVSYVAEHFALSNHLLNNYPIYIIVMGVFVLIALYAKSSGNVGSGI